MKIAKNCGKKRQSLRAKVSSQLALTRIPTTTQENEGKTGKIQESRHFANQLWKEKKRNADHLRNAVGKPMTTMKTRGFEYYRRTPRPVILTGEAKFQEKGRKVKARGSKTGTRGLRACRKKGKRFSGDVAAWGPSCRWVRASVVKRTCGTERTPSKPIAPEKKKERGPSGSGREKAFLRGNQWTMWAARDR